MIRDTEVINTEAIVISEDEIREEIVEYEDDDLSWFDDLDKSVFADGLEREQKRAELIRDRQTFKVVEQDVTNVVGAFWDFMTR